MVDAALEPSAVAVLQGRAQEILDRELENRATGTLWSYDGDLRLVVFPRP